jgi:hypothetical protein
MQIAGLPVYATALHVVDHWWDHTKYGAMAHVIPLDVNHLAQEVATSSTAKHGRQKLLNAFFQHAHLEL